MCEKDAEEGAAQSFEEVTELLSRIFAKVKDRGTTTVKEKLGEALSEFHGTLRRIDEELEGGEEKKEA